MGPLLVAGVASVLWWHRSGDLRWYGIVQFGPALVLVPAGITEPRVRGLWRAGAAYVSAKLAESFDRPIYQAIGFSGHSMKPLAGGACGILGFTVELYLLRHGIAEQQATSGRDIDRSLTADGIAKLRVGLERSGAAPPALIVASPYLRAQQTARIAAERWGYKNGIATSSRLTPDSSPKAVWQEVRELEDVSAVAGGA